MGPNLTTTMFEAPREGKKRKKHHSASPKDTIRTVILSALSETLHLSSSELRSTSSFLSHGGNSISAIETSNKCKSEGVQLSVEALLTSSCLEETFSRAHLTQRLAYPFLKCRKLCSGQNAQNEIWADSIKGAACFSRATILTEKTDGSEVPACSREFESTEMQRVFLMDSCKRPGTNIIRFSQAFETRHIPVLKAAWKHVLDMESIFRSQKTSDVFESGAERTLESDSEWSEQTCHTKDELQLVLQSIPRYSSVISKFSTVTLNKSPDHTTIIWDVHHALIDGYSAMLLYQKVRYQAEGFEVQPGTPFVHVAKDLKLLQEHRSNLHKNFWEQQKLHHPHAKGKLHMEQPNHGQSTYTTTSVTLELNQDLQTWCASHNVTLAALHYSVWSLILSTYVNSDSVVFGTIVSGRGLQLPGAKDTIGPLVNSLPFFVNIDWSQSCEEHVRKIFGQMLKLQNVESSSPKDGFSRAFDSAIAMEVEVPSLEEFKIKPIKKCSFTVQTGFPLSITFNSSGQVKFHYQPHQLEAQDIELLRQQYDSWITALTTSDQNLECCMFEISRQCYGNMMLEEGNLGVRSTTISSIKEDLVTLFEKTATQYPDVVAIKKKDEVVTYAELDHQAGQLAYAMESLVNPSDVVCVYADRSVNWLIATYAVLKLGAVYAPLNLALPARTREINYRTANAALYLTPYVQQKKSAPPEARSLSVEEVLDEPASQSVPYRSTPRPKAPAYLCFTSGSTGTPKAVLCRHGSLVAFQKDLTVRLNAQPGQSLAQIMSPAFDGSIHEIFSALSYGATLMLPASSTDLCHLRESHSAILTPSLARVLNPRDYPRLRQVYFVGEPVPQQVCDTWASSKQVFNMYGPTESTCGATIKELHQNEAVTIGKANPSSRVYILDRHKQPCPPKVIGDIYTAGVQVAIGYLGLPELNADRFFPDPFYLDAEEKMYLTGDRGCWTSTGEIRCLGRSDRQIKLNGFRLDLNLLEEQMIEDIPQLTAVGLVKKHDFLQAAVVPSSVDTSLLKSQLAKKLPLYSVPRYLFPMDALPKTVISKVDYAAIEALEPSSPTPEYTSAVQETEKIVECLWKEILNLDQKTALRPQSKLHELGGDSLTQLALANRLSQTFGRAISIRQVIESPTLRDLALSIGQLSQVRSSQSPPPSHVQIVSSLEADWVKKYELDSGTSAFNVSVVWQFKPQSIDREKLAKAWNTVLSRNSIFSSYFVGGAVQGSSRAYHKCPPRVQLVHEFNLAQVVDKPFQLQCDHLVRVLISSSKMLVVISHILCDLTTLRILLKDVASLYLNSSADLVLATSEQGPIEQKDVCLSDLEFWSQTLATAPALRTWRHIPPRKSYEGRSDARWLPRDLLQSLTQFSHAEHFTLHQLALAATALALQHDTDSQDIVLGAPFLNRSSEELCRTGLFLEPLPIRVRHISSDQEESVLAFLSSVRHASQCALAHRIPWFRLLQHLNASCTPPHNPFFDVMVTFHDFRHEELLPIPGLEQLQSWSMGSKFKLMVEISAYGDESMVLRLEYDPNCFNEADVDRIHALMVDALVQLTANTTISGLCQTLKKSDTRQCTKARTVHVGSLTQCI